MGRAMKNLDKLLAMPYGCGEQNMVLFAPNIFILNYLQSTGQLTQEIQDKATRFLESGERLALPPITMYSRPTQGGSDVKTAVFIAQAYAVYSILSVSLLYLHIRIIE